MELKCLLRAFITRRSAYLIKHSFFLLEGATAMLLDWRRNINNDDNNNSINNDNNNNSNNNPPYPIAIL